MLRIGQPATRGYDEIWRVPATQVCRSSSTGELRCFGHRLVNWTMVHWPYCGSDHGLLLAVPMLWERGFTCVGYIDESGSCLPFTAEGNLNAPRA